MGSRPFLQREAGKLFSGIKRLTCISNYISRLGFVTKTFPYIVLFMFPFLFRSLYQLILHHQKEANTTSNKKKSKSSSLSDRLTIEISGYKANDFKKFLDFVQSGKVKVDVQSVVGE